MANRRDWLKDLRERAGLTQLATAGRLGVTLRAVQQWEGAERDPSRENVFALAREFGQDVIEGFQREVFSIPS